MSRPSGPGFTSDSFVVNLTCDIVHIIQVQGAEFSHVYDHETSTTVTVTNAPAGTW